ncbi:hypothetical protein EXIGLDRAFT_698571 [Exidia glandulosa HHB12029]|uniref:Uncharacterized protein n=1 Tax=Exidia glandulosa HHB12029 TaxID=1314781 RepID=A0A165MMB5_EXIGL|nr:hypothetical protein EXIGLDRAFT_698571 [Exidia glandulosa HHB12029]
MSRPLSPTPLPRSSSISIVQPPPPPHHSETPSLPSHADYDHTSAKCCQSRPRSPHPTASRRPSGIGTRIRGSLEVVHGAGEILRGNVQTAIGSFGDNLAGRSHDSDVGTSAPSNGGSVVRRGTREMHNGIDKVKGLPPRHP